MKTDEMRVNMSDPSPRLGSRENEWRNVLIRMPAQMVDHLDRCADAMYRTRTAEILFRLDQSMEGESIDGHGVIVRQTGPKGK